MAMKAFFASAFRVTVALLGAALVAGVIFEAYISSLGPIELYRAVQAQGCMLAVLKAVPGVSDPKSGWTENNGVFRAYVEYRANEGARWQQPTQFVLQPSSGRTLYFQAILPGLVPVGSSSPDAHITNAVMASWKAQCRVNANIVFE